MSPHSVNSGGSVQGANFSSGGNVQNPLSNVGESISNLSQEELKSFGKGTMLGKSKLQLTLNKLKENKGAAQFEKKPQDCGLDDTDVANIKAYLEMLDPRSNEYSKAKEAISKTLVAKNQNISMTHFTPSIPDQIRIERFKEKDAAKDNFESALNELGNFAKSFKEGGPTDKLSQLKKTIEGYVKRFEEGTNDHSVARSKVTAKLLSIEKKTGVSIPWERIQ